MFLEFCTDTSVIVCLCMYALMIFFIIILDSRLANVWERNCPFGFCLKWVDCDAVDLSTSFFPLVFRTEGR